MKTNRTLFIAIAAAALLSLSAGAEAQAATRVTPCDAATPNNAICFQWTHDGKDVNGVPISGVTFRIQQKFGSGAFADIATNVTVFQKYVQNLAPGPYVFRVFANCSAAGCVDSNASNQVSGTATPNPIQPSAPVLIIAATIRKGQPPIYRIVYTVKPKDGEIVFVAPESMRPVFAAR